MCVYLSGQVGLLLLLLVALLSLLPFLLPLQGDLLLARAALFVLLALVQPSQHMREQSILDKAPRQRKAQQSIASHSMV